MKIQEFHPKRKWKLAKNNGGIFTSFHCKKIGEREREESMVTNFGNNLNNIIICI